MNRSGIVAVLRGPFLASGIAAPAAWPNVPAPGGAPRVDVGWTDPDRTSRTVVQADGVTERGRMVLTAVGLADDGENPTNALADSLAAAYTPGLRLTGPGLLVVLGVPIVRSGYRDGPEWRVPVVVPYDAYPA